MAMQNDRKMLKNIRHISEGHFYGLRVTNKAQRVCLEKELKTLEACKDAQTHVFRKEEKELHNTLVRLQKSKDAHHLIDEHLHRHYPELFNDEDGARMSNANIEVSHSPDEKITLIELTQKPRTPTQEAQEAKLPRDVGMEIHRTGAFIDCVICKLPRYLQHSGQERICTCEKGPEKGSHKVHSVLQHEKKLQMQPKKEVPQKQGKSFNEDDAQVLYDKLHRDIAHVLEGNGGERRRWSIGDEQAHFPHPPGGLRHRHDSMLDEERVRARRMSIDENGPFMMAPRPRRGSTEEPEWRRGRTQTSDSIGGESYFSVGELRSRATSLEDPHVFRKVLKVHTPFQAAEFERHYEPRPHHPTRESVSHLPHLRHAPSDHTSTEHAQSQAYHGLVHPDNIYNHHHYLPYEAQKATKAKRSHGDRRHSNLHHHDEHHYFEGTRFHDDRRLSGNARHHDNGRRPGSGRFHDELHPHGNEQRHGYYVHKYDHTGARQVMFLPSGGSTHVAEVVEKQHEPQSVHLNMLSKLRQLLNVYQDMDDTSPKYPWPSPSSVPMSHEEFQKLKECRYLRLPKSSTDARMDSEYTHS